MHRRHDNNNDHRSPFARQPRLRAAARCSPPAQTQPPRDGRRRSAPVPRSPAALSPALADAGRARRQPTARRPIAARIYKGTGVVVEGPAAGRRRCRRRPPVQPTGGGVVLNFEGADLREVVRNILGDILNETYTIDPGGRRHR